MRGTNHHGRGTAKHISRQGYTAPHIDPKRSKNNLYWTWDGDTVREAPNMEAAEMRYYSKRFQPALDAQNERYRGRRQYAKIRTMEQVYRDKMKAPEESLLYIGDKQNLGDVSPETLWACAAEYANWEMAWGRAHGNCYKLLSLALHADERGQIHMHERGVYQHKDADGNWTIGQAAALEAAGVPLPDPSAPRSRKNNRKQTWDALRREKWLDIIEAHGFQVEREPEADRPHLPLAAWQYLQEEKKALQDAQEAAEAALEAERVEVQAERQKAVEARQKAVKWHDRLDAWHKETKGKLAAREKAISEKEADVSGREAAVSRKEGALTAMGREEYARKLKEAQSARQEQRSAEAARIAPTVTERHGKRCGKVPPPDRGPSL